MTERRGHRLVEHTADEIVEAWGPTRASCLEEAAAGLVELFARPAPAAPIRHYDMTFAGPSSELLLGILTEIIYLADAEDAVPVAIRVHDHGKQIQVHLELVKTDDVEPTGPTPKGVSHSGLDLHTDGIGWRSRALIDV